MVGPLTIASVPGPRAAAWERFASPRWVWIAAESENDLGSVSLARRASTFDASPKSWGYLGELRVVPEWRRRGVATALIDAVAEKEREAHSFCTALATLDGNADVAAFMRHQHLPRTFPVARMRLVEWLVLSRARVAGVARQARESDLDDIWRLVSEFWNDRLFAPACERGQFTDEWLKDSSFRLANAFVVERGGRLAAVCALWDQRDLRRDVVLAYRLPLRVVTSALRARARWSSAPTLPPCGEPLPIGFVRYLAAIDAEAARQARAAALAHAYDLGLAVVMWGVDRRDPLANVARGFPRVELGSTWWVSAADERRFDPASLLTKPAYVDYSLV
jgi:GNAT superfamily N-acetyltransferase